MLCGTATTPATTTVVRQGDPRLRLLNYQNNLITKITNLSNLPNLIFIDLYNNYIDTLEGPLSTMGALRVLMVGKNKIEKVSDCLGSVTNKQVWERRLLRRVVVCEVRWGAGAVVPATRV